MSFTVITGEARMESSSAAGRSGSSKAERRRMQRGKTVCRCVNKRGRAELAREDGVGESRERASVYTRRKMREQEWRRERRQTHVITKLFHL